MSQSNLYKWGDSTAQTVEVTSDDARDLGDVDIKSFGGAVDITSDIQRSLGKVLVDAPVQTDLAAALDNDVLRTVIQTAALGVENAAGTQINPATEETLGNIDSSNAQARDHLATVESNTENLVGSQQTTEHAVTNSSGIQFNRRSVATAGTAESLTGGTATPVGAGKAVAVQAIRGNSGSVYVGDSTVDSATGYPLAPGQVVTLAVEDVSTIYVDADNATDAVAWIVESDE